MPEVDISFGFDNAKYSDRTLLLQIVANKLSKVVRKVKRRRKLTEPLVVPINSLVLGARSSFFKKLFSNGMLESEQKNVTIQIEKSEKAPMMDMLKYVHSNTLPTTLDALLDLLVTADKFEVPSCLSETTRALLNLPMTCESASLYLELPPTLLMSPQLHPLTHAAKNFLVSKFKDLDKFIEEGLNLPLPAIQALVSSDEWEVSSEYAVFCFVLKWVHKHFPNSKKRRGILETHLLHLIRFPFMTTKELTEEVQTCIDIDSEVASKIVMRAITFKAETPHRKRCLAAAEEGNAASRQFVERAYKHRPINVIELALPYKQCIVYLYFKRENIIQLFPEGRIASETFYLGEQKLVLFGRCSVSTESKRQYFWLGLELVGSTSYCVNYEIQLKMKPSEEFRSWVKGTHTFTESKKTKKIKYVGGVLWAEFIGDDSNYFINNFLHVRAELTTKE